jgi:hypothetical protein
VLALNQATGAAARVSDERRQLCRDNVNVRRQQITQTSVQLIGQLVQRGRRLQNKWSGVPCINISVGPPDANPGPL